MDAYAVQTALQNHQADAQQSREQYQAALALYPNHIKAHINWGNLELAVGNPEAAISHYQDAVAQIKYTPPWPISTWATR